MPSFSPCITRGDARPLLSSFVLGLASIALCMFLSPEHAAAQQNFESLQIDGAWSRATAPTATVGAGYLTITNTGSESDRLIGGSAVFAERIEIHGMAMAEGVMRMFEIEGGLEIPPGETVTLRPGGEHIMFMALARPLVEGETVDVRLVFERGGEVLARFIVQAPGATTPPPAAER